MTEMILKTLVVGPLDVNCYLIGDAASGPVAIIDPGGDSDQILEAVQHLNRTVSFILNTHCHFDHVGAVAELMDSLGVDYFIHCDDRKVLANMSVQMEMFGFQGSPAPVPTRCLNDGDNLTLGNIILKVIHTPGHSPGGICLYCAETGQILSGDSLFLESIGRTDLPGGSSKTLLTSIREKLLVLPKDVRVYPGHGPSTTIGHELKTNPFL